MNRSATNINNGNDKPFIFRDRYISQLTKGWKTEHFIIYLFLTLADADEETTDDELDMAFRRTQKILLEHFDHSIKTHKILFDDVKRQFGIHKLDERTEIIEMLSKNITFDEELKIDLICDLNDLISSDDIVTESEYKALNFVRSLLVYH